MSKKPMEPEIVPTLLTNSTPPEMLTDSSRDRIVVAVARTLNYTKAGSKATYKMEPGRQIAQAAHAVSALKLHYCESHAANDKNKLARLVVQIMENPITTIVLQARDTNEIIHLANLCTERNLLSFVFSDDNEPVYGANDRIPTAIAIGPVNSSRLFGTTDYLPLWKDGISDIG